MFYLFFSLNIPTINDLTTAPTKSNIDQNDGNITNILSNITPELATVQLMDASGRIISTNMNVTAGQTLTLSTLELASGVYFVKISNDNFSVNKKIVVNN